TASGSSAAMSVTKSHAPRGATIRGVKPLWTSRRSRTCCGGGHRDEHLPRPGGWRWIGGVPHPGDGAARTVGRRITRDGDRVRVGGDGPETGEQMAGLLAWALLLLTLIPCRLLSTWLQGRRGSGE